jgi:hypothetical protein
MDDRVDELMRRVSQLEEPADVPAPPPSAEPDGKPADDVVLRKWLDKLRGRSNDAAFSATVELAALRDPRALKPLVGALRAHPDFYVRLGAATALGQMEALDAVPALIDALDDKDQLVRTAAAEALYGTTGHTDIRFGASDPREERLQTMEVWRTWWQANEERLRVEKK